MLRREIVYCRVSNDNRFPLVIAGGVGVLLGIVSLWFSPSSVIIGFLVGSVSLIILTRPEVGVLCLLVMYSTLVAEPNIPRVPIGIGSFSVADVVLLGLLGLVFVRWISERDFHILHTPLDLPLLAFYCLAMGSTIAAIIGGSVTIKDSVLEVRTVNTYLVFFVITNLVYDERQLRLLLRGLFFLSTTVAVAMIIQYLLGHSVPILPGGVMVLNTEGVVSEGITRIVPPGESLVLVAFVTLTVHLISEGLRPTSILKYLLLGILGLALILTYKRHLWIGVGVDLLILACVGTWQSKRRLLLWGLLTALLLAFAMLLVALEPRSPAAAFLEGSIYRLDSLTKDETYLSPQSSLRWRDTENAMALPQITSYPLLGLGLGAKYRPLIQGFDWAEFDGRAYIHDAHLWIMLKVGLLGYLSFAWLSFVFLWRVFKCWRFVSDLWMRAVLLGFALSYITMLIGSVVSPILMKPSWTPVIAVFMGVGEVVMSGRVRAVHRDDEQARARKPIKARTESEFGSWTLPVVPAAPSDEN